MAELESTMQWKVDITQFTAAMQEAKKSLQATNNEFKLTTSTMEKWGNNTAGIEAKLKQLGGTLEAEKRILDVYSNAWEEAKKEFGEASPEAERLAKKVEDQQIKINKTQVQLDKYNQKLKEMQKEQKGSETASGKLNKEIEEQEKQLSSLKDEYKDAVIQYGKNSEEAKKLASQIDKLSGELKENKDQMHAADKAADDLDQSLDEVADSANQAANGGFTVLKGALANLVSQGINAAINGFKNLARETFNVGANFESAMSQVAAVSGASADDLERLTAKAKEMGENTKFSATEAAEAFNYMAMAGWKTEDMLDGIEGIMNLAAASGADLATTSDIVTDALTAMGYSAKDAGTLADVMAAASSNANTNVEMMGATFKYAAPIVGALGYTMEDTAVAIGLMANAGIKGEMAGTALRSILTRLSVDTDGCTTALKEMGVEVVNSDGSMRDLSDVIVDLRKVFDGLSESEQTALAKNIAGQEAMSGLLAIVNAAPEDFNKLTEAVDKSSGAAQRMADTMNDNVSGQITLLRSKIEGIMIKVFEKASTAIRKSIRTISNTLDSVDWDKFANEAGKAANSIADFFAFVVKNAPTIVNTLKTIAVAFVTYKAVDTITSVVGAFKGLFTAVKAGTSVMAAFNSTMALNPYALVAAGIGVLALAVYDYAKKEQEATEAQWGLNEAQKANIETAYQLKDATDATAKSMAESSANVAVEYGKINELKNKYNELIGSNGKVKKGYEERAEYILNELASALGVEREEINKIIDANGKLGDSYDELVQKRKVQAMLNATEADYNQAIKDQAEATKAKVNSYNDLIDAQMNYDEAVRNGGEIYDTYQQLMSQGLYKQASDFALMNAGVIDSVNVAKSALDEAQLGYDNASLAWEKSANTIMLYNDLVEASTAGDVAKMNESMLKMQYGFETAENGTRESLERQTSNFKKMYDDWKVAAESGMEGVSQEQLDELATLIRLSEEELAKLPPEAKTEGENTVEEFAAGVKAVASKAKTATEKVADEAVKGAKSENGEKGGANSSGKNFTQGFINGINNSILATRLWNAAKNLAKKALNALKAGQREGSPSKLTRQSGIFFGEGYELGIIDMIKPVTDAASKMATEAVGALSESMDDELFGVGANGGNSFIDGLNSVSATMNNLKSGVAFANSGINGYGQNVGTVSTNGKSVTNLNFYQTNNSPKALNRWDVYRQTQNILELVKG